MIGLPGKTARPRFRSADGDLGGGDEERFGMMTRLKVAKFSPLRMGRRLFVKPAAEAKAVYWRINGFRARLVVWTDDEWKKLERRPADAQYHPSGIWCALRVD
jgi:hypothetical protein